MAGPVTVKVGCCGFPVAHPKYFKTFPVVEIQQTFYQPPKPETLRRWREEAPHDFEFTLKAWQLITHEARSPTYRRLRVKLEDSEKAQAGSFRPSDLVRGAWETTLEAARFLRADKVVFQCPASFEPTPENRDRMRRFFRAIDRHGILCIWEPRGKWRAGEVAELCRELNLVHCVDPFQAEAVTGGTRYYRLHGIGGYRHRYTDEELEELPGRRSRDAATYFLFNNVGMWEDAARCHRRLAERTDTVL
jgi:uncharacterized protein YecE (DUF72 family)